MKKFKMKKYHFSFNNIFLNFFKSVFFFYKKILKKKNFTIKERLAIVNADNELTSEEVFIFSKNNIF